MAQTTTVYTQGQEKALADVLATHRIHHTDNDGRIRSSHVDAPQREWPAALVLGYMGPGRNYQQAEVPGMTRETLSAGPEAAGYFSTNLGGVDLYGVRALS